jgi:glycosyltransferase involved in cell wall biosynthesis
VRIAWTGPRPGSGGGVRGVARQLIEGLLEAGHEVDCYLTGTQAELPPALQDRSGLHVEWLTTPWRWDRWYSRTRTSAFVTGLAARAVAFSVLGRRLCAAHARRPYDVVYQFSRIELLGLRHRLARLPPVVVHPGAHAAGELRWWRAEAALVRRCEAWYRRTAVRAVLTVRSQVQRRHLRRAAAVICPSEHFRADVERDYGVGPERTHVVAYPVDLERFTPRLSHREAGPPQVLFVGRVAVRKGIDVLVEVTRRVAELERDIRFRVVGGPSQWSDYRSVLADADRGNTTVVGSLAAEELAEELRRADVLVVPSKYEPFGLTVAEALASGVPVVASEAVGAAEGVDPRCCRLVPVDDPAATEAAVVDVTALATETAGETRAVARSEAERLYDPERFLSAVTAVLERVAEAGPEGSEPTVNGKMRRWRGRSLLNRTG